MASPIDLTPRYDQFAVYLPALQTQFARAVGKRGEKDRQMPTGISMRDLDFLNPNSKLWHYAYSLYSVGQFGVGEHKGDAVINRDKAKTLVLGDSGGYQIGKGTLKGFKALKKLKKADDACKAWREAHEVREWIVTWLELHCDYAMTIDMPLWAKDEANKKTPFHNCSVEQLTQLTVENLEFINQNRRGRTKWLNVVQGATEQDTENWWNAVKRYKFGGWALAGKTGWRGGSARVIKQVLLMRDEGAFEKGLDWLHVLGVSQTTWAVLLSAVQRGIRANGNENFRVSCDSASSNILGGKFQQVVLTPDFTSDPSSWSIRAETVPQSCADVKKKHKPFPYSSPLGDVMTLGDVVLSYDEFKGAELDAVSFHMLTNHNMWIYLSAMLKANELAAQPRSLAEPFVPQALLDVKEVYEDLLASSSGKWFSKWKKAQPYFEALDGIKVEA
jgi:hypothetical protein